MTLKGKFRIITTGTPIENHLGELFTLFNFINPGLLGSALHFFNTFSGPIEKQQDSESRDRLKKIIQPFMLRRMKSQVLAELPSLTEIMLKVDLYPGEAAFYESIRKNAFKVLESGRTGTGLSVPRVRRNHQTSAGLLSFQARSACKSYSQRQAGSF
jgi:SNF2 family DNA or RNA helicase